GVVIQGGDLEHWGHALSVEGRTVKGAWAGAGVAGLNLVCKLSLTWRTSVRILLLWIRWRCSRPLSAISGSAIVPLLLLRRAVMSLRELREVIDALEVEFSSSARAFQLQGGHLADGCPGVVSWLRQNCKISGTSAADRVCVGKELEALPHTAESLAAGGLGFQSAAAIC